MKRLIGAAVLSASLFALNTVAQAAPAKPLKIGFSNRTLNGAFFNGLTEYMKISAKAAGYEIIATDAAGNMNKQISDVEDMLSQGITTALHAGANQGTGDYEGELRAAIRGYGAGMEPGPDARLQDGWLVWQPQAPAVPELVLILLLYYAGTDAVNRLLALLGSAPIDINGLVAGIVKLDDLGLRLQRSTSTLLRKLGMGLLHLAPRLMKTLSVVGTAAMFMVGGGILVHGWPFLHHLIEGTAGTVAALPGVGGVLAVVTPTLLSALAGVVAGLVLVVAMTLGFVLAGQLGP